MAKKKATMTLKDFHGGSIPSDLPLPSAPGVIVRPLDRLGFDRPTAWGNPMGRSDNRLRPGSAGSARNFDDKTPFLTHNTHIGRNFDEDERTPLDGVSAPRRTISDDSSRALAAQSEPNLDYIAPSNHPVLTPVSQFSSGTVSSYAGRFTEGVNSHNISANRASYQNRGGNGGQTVAGSSPNAWGLKKEVVGNSVQVSMPWSAPDAATKLAHASALEKVSSGRWHSKLPTHHQSEVEVIRHPETESEIHSKDYGGVYSGNANDNMDVAVGGEFHEAVLVRQAEKSLTVDNEVGVGGKELPVYERPRSPMYSETKERNLPISCDRLQPPSNVGKFGGLELQPAVRPESSERPKLKLLPRSKPLENVEALHDYKQPYQPPVDPGHVHYASETHGKVNSLKSGLAEPESANRVLERPKFSLNPRSQPHEQLEENIEAKRKTVFGGARPRELILKERGITDVAVSNHEHGHSSNRIGRNIDKRELRVDVEKSDVQRRNWRNENRKSSREFEKQAPPQERPPSPETWRKPVEQPASSSGMRYGKATSAVELAQAFSRSVSDAKTSDRHSGQRGLPSRGQIPFSRLTGSSPRPQINGY